MNKHFFPSTPRDLTYEKQRFQGSSNKLYRKTPSDASPLRQSGFESEEPSFQQKTIMTMKMTKKKLIDEIEGMNNQIYEAKIPYLNYYHKETNILKSNKEIFKEMKTRFSFFSDFPLDPKQKFKVKDFYSEGKKSFRIKTIKSPKEMKEFSINHYQERNSMRGFEKNQDYTELEFGEKLTTNPETNSDLEPAPDCSVHQKKRETLKQITREENQHDLGRSVFKRRKIYSELNKKKDFKGIVALLSDQSEDTSLAQDKKEPENPKNQPYVIRKKNLLKKIEFGTKSPYSNAYYQILALPPSNRKDLVCKLSVPPINEYLSKFKY